MREIENFGVCLSELTRERLRMRKGLRSSDELYRLINGHQPKTPTSSLIILTSQASADLRIRNSETSIDCHVNTLYLP